METKICSKCKVGKDICDFGKNKLKSDGLQPNCKLCRKIETSSYYKTNSEKIKLKVQEYRNNNPEKVSELKKNSYERNKEYYLNQMKIYREKNKEKRNNYSRNRKKTDPIFKLKHIMNSRLRIFLKSKNITKNNKTFEIIGCTPQKLKQHLENKFTEGMKWELIGQYIHIDHITPLCSAKTEEEIFKLCHYTNLQPMWAIDNIKKGGKY